MTTKQQDIPTTRFERVFFRYVAWFPILTLPLLVWELLGSGQTGAGLIIGLVHAVLVFRFVSVNNVPGWFRRSKAP